MLHTGLYEELVKLDKAHNLLSKLSEKCRAAAAGEDFDQIAALESEIDEAAAHLWGITDKELKAIQKALADTLKSKRSKTAQSSAQKDEDE